MGQNVVQTKLYNTRAHVTCHPLEMHNSMCAPNVLCRLLYELCTASIWYKMERTSRKKPVTNFTFCLAEKYKIILEIESCIGLLFPNFIIFRTTLPVPLFCQI